jgi:short-subunit dehydrogenase
MELTNKVAVITGASMGIGEAITKVFLDQGARVVLLSRDANRAETARHQLGHTDRTLALSCDVRNREEIDRVLGLTLHHYDRLDIWVNNAGFGMRDSAADMPMNIAHDLFETNYFAAISGIQAVVPVMRRQGGGTIINISSVAGHLPLPFNGAYSASKFAMNALGRGARIELMRDNINVLTVCPGFVRTNFQENMYRGSSDKRVRPSSARGISAERVAHAVLRGYLKRKREVVVPWTMHPVIKLYQLFPGVVEWGMLKMLDRKELTSQASGR